MSLRIAIVFASLLAGVASADEVTGGMVDGKYVLIGTDDAGVLQRWATEAEGPDSVVGRFDVSEDQGKTWRTVGVNTLRRAAGR